MKHSYLKNVFFLLSFFLTFGVFAQWTATPTPSSYHLYAIDAVTNDVIYAGGYGGSLVRSTDGGDTWEALSIESYDWVKAIHFFDTNYGWLVTTDGTASGGNILKTTDGGATWTPSHTGYAYSAMEWIDDQICYVSTWQGILVKTTNAGATWTIVTTPHDDVNIFSIQFFNEETGFALNTDYDLMSTTDGGETWTTMVHYGLRNFHFLTPSIGFGVNAFGEIGKTTDGGLTFDFTPTEFEDIKLNDVHFLNDDIGYVIGGLDCTGGDCIQSPVLLTTNNGGETWITNAHPLEGMARGFYEVSISPNGTPFIAGSDKMVLKNALFSGLEEALTTETISAYPNPSNGDFTLNVPLATETINITNLLGQNVKTINTLQNNQIQISLDDVTAGLYLIKLLDRDGILIGTCKIQMN